MRNVTFILCCICMLSLSDLVICQVVYTLNTKELIQKPHTTESDYVVIEVPGYQMSTEVADPQIPVMYLRFGIPRGMKADNLEYKVQQRETITLDKKILPAQHPIPTSLNYQWNGFVEPKNSIYQRDSLYPGKIAEIVQEGLFDGDIPIVTIAVYPVQYNPVKNVIDILSSLEIKLNYTVSERIAISKKKTKRNLNEHKRLLSSAVDNHEDISRFGLDKFILETSNSGDLKSVTADFEYLVITSEDLAASFTHFMAWKRRKGIDIGLVTVEDISSEYSGDLTSGIYDEAGKIREFLKDMYTNYCLEYVLLGGDNTVVPIRYGCGSNNLIHSSGTTNYLYYIPADLYFADFTGDWKVDADTLYGESSNDDPDYESEIYVGRLLCSSEDDIKRWTKKLLQYEMDPGDGNGSYVTKSLMIQSDQMQDGEQADYVSYRLGDFTHTIWEEAPSYNSSGIPTFPTGDDAIDEMNENYGLISWFSHAGPPSIGIGTLGVNTFGHNYKYNICALDEWDEDDSQSYSCIEESGNGLDNLSNYDYPGIVYTIGCETMPFDNSLFCPDISVNLGQAWTTNTFAGGPAFLGNTRVGWVSTSYQLQAEFADIIDDNTTFHLGKAEALSKNNYSSHYLRYSHDLIGCPETEIWTDSPSTFSNVTVTENGSSVTVSTGVTGSNICVMNAVYNGTDYCENKSDVSSWTFSNVPSQYLVTITKHDYLPYLVNPETTYVQNETFNSVALIHGENIEAGSNVTQDITSGPVTINNGASVIFEAEDEIVIEGVFEVKAGATFEVAFN